MSLPFVGVAPHREFPSARSLDDPVEPLEVLRLDEAMEHNWSTDAHFATYYPVETGAEVWPRINKLLVPKLRAVGADLVTRLLVLEFDNAHHAPWAALAPGAWTEFLLKLDAIANEWPLAWQWSYLHTTRSGVRMIYVLKQPVSIEDGEAHNAWLVDQFNRRGGWTGPSTGWWDPTTSQWHRLYRLPRVIRDGEKTWEAPYYEAVEQFSERIYASHLGKAAPRKVGAKKVEVVPLDLPKPTIADVQALLEELNIDTGRMVQSAWRKEAKRRLKGRACYPCLFQHKTLADRGSRNTTIFGYVGEATTLLYRVEINGKRVTTPQHIYALFLEAVEQLEPDAETPDWTDVLWRAVLYCWAEETAEVETQQRELEQAATDALTLMERLVDGVRSWCEDRAVHGTDEQAMEWVYTHLIAYVGNAYYVMNQRGRYDSVPLRKEHIPARVRALGMEPVIEISVITDDGKKEVAPQTLINRHCTIVARQRAAPGIDGSYIEKPDSEDSCFVTRMFERRRDLVPTYDADVDEWLKQLGGPYYQQIVNWIAHALAFDEGPTCALSLKGAAGAGKKMLALGLAECVSTETVATANDLMADFQPGLFESPFLVVDEGWPRGSKGGKHPADTFRELVGGGSRPTNRKFLAPITVTNPMRIVFTANGLNVVSMLTEGRDLSPEDREALAIRLLHFDIGDRASRWLEAKGGTALTARPGRRWIRGDGNQKSDYVLAKHFLWLYENCRQPPGKRFLVEGNSNQEFMFDLRTRGGAAPFVVELLVKMIESRIRIVGMTEEVIEGQPRVFVITSAVLEFYRAHLMQKLPERLTAAAITAALKGLVRSAEVNARLLPSRKEIGKQRWYELDCAALLSAAQRDGWQSPRLEAVVRAQEQAVPVWGKVE